MQMLTLLAALAQLPNQVHFVHPTQGPFLEIRDAVQAAADGDVILVSPGQYQFFGVNGKGLTILPRTAAGAVSVHGTVRVQAVPAGSTVTLKGLRLNGSLVGDPPLRCASNQGAVRIEGCSVQSSLTSGAVISDCEDVTLVDFESFDGGVGLFARDSDVTLFGGRYFGRSMAGLPWGPAGRPGIEVVRCRLFASGVHAVGGDGGEEETWIYTCLAPAGPGGPGIAAWDSEIEVLDVSLVPGQYGIPWSGYCPFGFPPIPPIATEGTTTVTWHTGEALELSVGALGHVGSGGTLDVTLLGEVGAPSVLLIGPSASHVQLPGITGVLLVGGGLGSVRRLSLGSAPVSRSLPLPSLSHPFGLEHFRLQAMQFQTGGAILGPPRSLALLGSAW